MQSLLFYTRTAFGLLWLQVPSPVADYTVLSQLADRAARECYAMSVQGSGVTDNVAQVRRALVCSHKHFVLLPLGCPKTSLFLTTCSVAVGLWRCALQGSGGAFFASSNNSLLISSCADIQATSPQQGVALDAERKSCGRSATSTACPCITLLNAAFNSVPACCLIPLHPHTVGGLSSSPALVVSCPANGNSVQDGYGPIIATLPASLSINQTTTQQQLDPSQNASDLPAVPLVRFVDDGSFVLPSTAPLTPAVIHMRVLDAAGQDVQGEVLMLLQADHQ